jgi:hypothetical protein
VTFLKAAVLLCVAFVAAGCSSISIRHDFDQDADFASYRTYAWLEQPTTAVGDVDAARQMNTLLDKRIRAAVDAELTAKGLTSVAENPDLLIAYHTGVENKIDVTDWGYTYPTYYGGWYGGRDIDVYTYHEGTLIVDLIDAKAKQLVWRGEATKTLETDPTPEQREQNLHAAVSKMFANYPPSK